MSGRVLVITLTDEVARVAHADRRLVEPLVSAPSIRWTSDGPVTGTRSWVSAGAADATGFAFAPKLAQDVAAALRANGFPVLVTARGWAGPGDPPVTGGLIRYAAGAEPDGIVPRLIDEAVYRRVMLAATNRQHTAYWVRLLDQAGLGRPVMEGRTYADTTPGGPKVVVASIDHLNWIQAPDFDLVVVPDARPLRAVPLAPPVYGRPHRYYPLTRRLHAPAYGFVPAAMPLSPAERLTLGTLFGSEVRLGGKPTAPVAVRVERDPTGPRPDLPDAAVEPWAYRQAAIWENAPRTAWVGGLATAAAAENPEARVLLLAEAAHAEALAAAAGWQVLAPGHVGTIPTPAVATVSWANGQRPVPADLLIDARGWGAVDFLGFPPRGATSVTLIDAGVAGADGERRTVGRMNEYRRRNWSITAAIE